MCLGRRDLEEYQYLIDHGIFAHYCNKHLIVKQHGRYQLLRNNAPVPELEAEANTLDGLIKLFDIPIAQYQWHINWLEEDDNEALETLERQQEDPA